LTSRLHGTDLAVCLVIVADVENNQSKGHYKIYEPVCADVTLLEAHLIGIFARIDTYNQSLMDE
jgi:hypothetical protein